MDIRKLQRVIVDGLEDVKGQNIAVFDTEHLSPLFERVIIASGTSNRQTRSLAASVREAVKSHGFLTPRVEGEDNGEWIIVDCGAAVVHLMQPGIRDYYHLEELWGDKPVKFKAGKASVGLVKASEPDAQEAPAAKRAAGKTAAKKAPVEKKVAAAKKAPAARKIPAAKNAPAAKKVSAKTVPAVKRTVTRTVGVRSPTADTPSGQAALKKIAAAKAPRKTAARKTAARKSTASRSSGDE